MTAQTILPSLRDPQQADAARLNQAMRPARSRVLFEAHCAYGKSHLIAYIVSRFAAAGWATWTMTPRSDLVADLSRRFLRWGVQHGVVADRSDYDWATGLPTQLMTTQSLDRHLDRFVNWTDRGHMLTPQVLIWDEADEWLNLQQRCYQLYRDVRGLALTATPYGTEKIYTTVIKGPSIAESTLARRLVPIFYFEGNPVDLEALTPRKGEDEEAQAERFYELNKHQILGGFEQNYQSHLRFRYNLVYGGKQSVAQGFTHWCNRQGIPATYIDADTNGDELRTWIIPRWQEEPGRLLVFPKRLGRGNDLPRADALSPITITRSRTVYEQVTGRIMRTLSDDTGNWLTDRHGEPLKADSLFFDHANWIGEHGLIYQNDHIQVPHNLKSLELMGESLALTQQKDRTARTRKCQRCRCLFDVAQRVCPACGAEQLKAWRPAVLCTPEEYARLSSGAKENAIEVLPASHRPLGFDPDRTEQRIAGKTLAQRRQLWAELRLYFVTQFNAHKARTGSYPKDKKGKPRDPIRTAKGVYFGRFKQWPEFAWDADHAEEYSLEIKFWAESRFRLSQEVRHASD